MCVSEQCKQFHGMLQNADGDTGTSASTADVTDLAYEVPPSSPEQNPQMQMMSQDKGLSLLLFICTR